MSVSTQRDVGSYVKDEKGINPANQVAATVNGTGIDRQGFNSCVLHGACGAASGGPTAQTVDFRLQDSATVGGTYVNLANAALTQLVADNGQDTINVDLSAAKAFIRVENIVGFTGGASPAIPVAAVVTLGGPDTLPAV